MARGDQLARQWKILQTLISSRRGKSVSDLADELESHWRTVYRDLEALQIAGFPIYTEKIDGKNLWTILDSTKHNVPIPLSLTELMALYLSRRMMNVLKHTVFYESLETFFQKIKATLPAQAIQYIEMIEKSFGAGSKPYKRYDQLKNVIEKISKGIFDRKVIEIEYYTMSRKKKTRRKVAPYKIWYFDGTFYLVGNCGLREDIRIFALDRIRKLKLTQEPFELPEDFNVDDFMQSSFGVFRGKPEKVRIWFAADVAGYISERTWHETQKIVPQNDGSIIFEAEVAGTDEIKFWVMKWGSNALVLGPQALREEIQSEAKAVLQNYDSRFAL
jgi:predicted DNA-binding transcriptional regulator YafY